MGVPESARTAFDEVFGDRPQRLQDEGPDSHVGLEDSAYEAALARPRQHVSMQVQDQIMAGLHPEPLPLDLDDSPKEEAPPLDAAVLPADVAAEDGFFERLRMLTPDEAAPIIGSTKGSLAQMRNQGLGPSYYKRKGDKSGRVRYLLEDLIAWRVANYDRYGARQSSPEAD